MKAFLPVAARLLTMLMLFSNANAAEFEVVPKEIQFAGALSAKDTTVGVTFSLFTEPSDGSALWIETQNISVDGAGHYSVLLGAETSEGIPQSIFSSGEARWLEVSYADSLGAQVTQPRVLLVSVPYAMKAGDAETLGGLPASAFLLNADALAARVDAAGGVAELGDVLPTAAVSGTGTTNAMVKWSDGAGGVLADSVAFSVGSNFGVGLSNPIYKFHVRTGVDQNFYIRPGTDLGAANGITFQSANDADSLNRALVLVGVPTGFLGGNVGIGLVSPAYKFHVRVNPDQNFVIRPGPDLGAANGVTFQSINDADNTNNAIVMVGNPFALLGGNFGIGTVTPAAKLDVVGNILTSGTVTGSSFVGDGSTLTGVPKLTAENIFTAPMTVTSATGTVVPDSGGNAFATFIGEMSGVQNPGDFGIGVLGANTNATGGGAGVVGFSHNPEGVGGFFTNDNADGAALVASDATDDDFLVATARGDVGIGNIQNGYARLTVRQKTLSPVTGTVSVTSGSPAVTGTGTLFTREVAVGDRVNVGADFRMVSSIASDTSLQAASGFNATLAGVAMTDLHAIFKLEDSVGSKQVLVTDQGNMILGDFSTTGNSRLLLTQGNKFAGTSVASQSFSNANFTMLTTNTQAADVGPILGFAGNRGSTAGTNLLAGLRGAKENGTDNDLGGYLGFYTVAAPGPNFSEKMRLSSVGYLGIGSVAPSARLSVVGSDATANGLDAAIRLNNTAAGGGAWNLRSGATGTNTPAGGFSVSDAADNYRLVIASGGFVGLGVLAPLDALHVNGEVRVANCVRNSGATQIAGTCPSDIRLKKDIHPLKSAGGLLDKVAQLEPVTFRWRADEFPEMHFGDKLARGLIAQQVQQVIPELVETNEDGFMAVNYSDLPLYMLQAMRELKEENDALKQELQQMREVLTDVQERLGIGTQVSKFVGRE